MGVLLNTPEAVYMGPNMRSFGHHGLEARSASATLTRARLLVLLQPDARGRHQRPARAAADRRRLFRSLKDSDGQGTLRQGHENPPRGARDAYVDRALAKSGPFNDPLQELVTTYCWGWCWGRDGLERRDRSLINLAMIAVLNRHNELKAHIRGALNNGLSKEEIREVLLQVGIYGGIPATVDSFRIANEAFAEIEAEEGADGSARTHRHRARVRAGCRCCSRGMPTTATTPRWPICSPRTASSPGRSSPIIRSTAATACRRSSRDRPADPRSGHLVSNVLVEVISETEARGTNLPRDAVRATLRPSRAGAGGLYVGGFEDHYVKSPGRWRFKSRYGRVVAAPGRSHAQHPGPSDEARGLK
jgi:4-carboxymuconolactone decarboxylase